ncbi:beta-phosphoglucomutase [Aeromonas allosaccharophila]|uniref:beta-phosphoglucomutase n=1 Tax=Aeromonas allosaccharophila TaxID=656 RepID=UPI0038CF9C23
MKLEAVVFDLDGVITDTAHYHFVAWRDMALGLGIHIDEAFNERLKGVSRLDSLRLILAHGGKADLFSDAELEAIATRKNEHYVNLLSALSPADILPGIAELLRELRQNGIRIGLASVSKNAPQVLAALGLTDAFDYCADAAKLTHSKPHPEIFLTACAGLGVTPAQAIGVEDAQAGVISIKAAGLYAVGVGSQLEGVDWLVPCTSHLTLPALLAHWADRQQN